MARQMGQSSLEECFGANKGEVFALALADYVNLS